MNKPSLLCGSVPLPLSGEAAHSSKASYDDTPAHYYGPASITTPCAMQQAMVPLNSPNFEATAQPRRDVKNFPTN
jgi:hypothetical protein